MRTAILALVTSTVACSRTVVTGSTSSSLGADPAATAQLHDATGRAVGAATFEAAEGGTRVAVHVKHLAPGAHGMHVHAVGKCDPDFAAAGGHFNPGMRQHGRDNPGGPHAGDMPNIVVGADSTGSATLVTSTLALDGAGSGLFGPAGTAVVVHAAADDYRTDPAGNSGARVACGVITRNPR